jgi:hypothetical protein
MEVVRSISKLTDLAEPQADPGLRDRFRGHSMRATTCVSTQGSNARRPIAFACVAVQKSASFLLEEFTCDFSFFPVTA